MLVLCTKCVNKNSNQYIDAIAIEENGKFIVKSWEEKKNK